MPFDLEEEEEEEEEDLLSLRLVDPFRGMWWLCFAALFAALLDDYQPTKKIVP